MTCTTAHPNTGAKDQDSKLNEELNKAFPGENVAGVNSHYLFVRQDPWFLNWFGNWTDETTVDKEGNLIYDNLLNDADNTAIFNEQGEPRLQYDITGNAYILNLKGRRHYLKPLFEIVSSNEVGSVVNTITGDFITYNYNLTEGDSRYDLPTFISKRFNEDVASVEALVAKYKKSHDAMSGKTVADKTRKNKKRDNLIVLQQKLKKLKSIQDNPNLQAVVHKRTLARLERYNFKYTEDIDDKEENIEDRNEIANFTKDSTETSNRAINDPVILSFLSSVPVFENYNETISKQRKKVNFLMSSNDYMDQNAVWNLLEGIFADVLPTSKNKDVFVNFKAALNSTANSTKQPALNYIADFLNNLEDNIENSTEFKAKFVGAFFKSNQNYLITQVKQEQVNGKYVTTFKIVDPAVKNNKVGKISNEYIETITNSREFSSISDFSSMKKKILKGYDIPGVNGSPAIHVKGFDEIKDKSSYDDYYAFLDEMLNNQLGLEITPEIIERYIEMRTIDGYQELREDLLGFLDTEIQSKDINPLVVSYPEGEFDLLAELRLMGNSKGVSNDAKQIFKDRLMANGSFFKNLATAAKLFSLDVSESSFLVGGSQRWAYSYTSGLNLELGKWKNGDLSSLKRLSNRGLKFVKHLLDDTKAGDRINSLEIYTNSEIKKENDSNPSLHKRITEIDYHLDNFIKMFNSKDTFYEESTAKLKHKGSAKAKKQKELRNYIMYNFGADKNSLFAIFGLPILTDGKQVYDPKNKELGEDLKLLLNDYVAGELRLVQEAGLMIDGYFKSDNKQKYLMENLIPGYHYNLEVYKEGHKKEGLPKRDIETEPLSSEDFKLGNYHKIGIFTTSLNKFLKENNNESALLFDHSSGYPTVHGSFFEQHRRTRSNENMDKLMAHVYNDINDTIQQNFKYLNDIILIRKENEAGQMEETKLFELENNMRTGEMEMSLYKYITASFLNNYEFSNIFNGHASYYKQKRKDDIELTDFLKRAPAVVTDGKYPWHRGTGESKTYTTYDGREITLDDKDDNFVVAVLNDIDVKRSIHADLISKATGEKMTFKHELADAQGYATPSHFRDLIERIYGWNNEDQKNFDELNDPSHKITDANIRWIKTASKSYTPLKMVHFEVNENNIPIYLKYSIAPLFPSMTSGTEMQRVLDQMESQGVEQVVFKSGSKASNNAPTSIHNMNDNGTYAGLKESMRFNPFLIDSSKTKMQVELPTKLDHQSKIGMQSPKNIMTNLDVEDTVPAYRLDNKMLTGKEIYDEANNVVVKMLQDQLNKLLKELGYIDGQFNKQSIKNLLMNQMDIETESDLIHMLQTDLPLEAIPNFGQRAFPVISSYLNKKGGKIYTNGSSVVQVANVGYDRLSKSVADGIFYFGKQTDLAPPLPETDANGNINYYDPETGKKSSKDEGGKMRIKKAKILLPFTSVFEKTGLSYTEFIAAYKANKIDKRLLSNIMGYRIPNQSMSSNDSFEIVGILPPMAGDTAVVYHEITAKTGSDFDIDKMYLAMPNFNVNIKRNDNLLAKLKESGLTKNIAINILTKEGYYMEGERITTDPILDLFFYLKNNEDSIEDPKLVEKIKEVSTITYDVESVDYIDDYTTKKGLQNRFIEVMNSILESPNSYNDLMSPLDSTIIKDTILKIDYLKDVTEGSYQADPELSEAENVKAHAETKVESGLTQMFPVSLLKSRVDVLEAKTLIAIMANNMTDIGESQKVDFGLEFPIGITNEDGHSAMSLARTYVLDQDGKPDMKLSKIVSYLMNASVDAAKDNYIISGNFTSYTANAAMMMTRMGMPLDDMFTVLMNKEILQFSRYKKFQTAKLSDFAFDYNKETLDEWSKRLLNDLASNNWDIFKVISKEDFLGNNPAQKENILAYWNILETMGKDFNDAVVSMKSDSNGAGKNIPEFISQKNRLSKVLLGTTTNSTKKWFEGGLTPENRTFNKNIDKVPGVKILGIMANNTMFLMEEVSKNLLMETTENVQKTVNNILAGLGRPLETDSNTIKLIYSYLYPYLLNETGHRIYDMNINGQTPEKRAAYLLGEFPRKLQRYKMQSKNAFLKQLDISTNKKRNLIAFPNYKNFAVQDKLDFKEALTDMMNDERLQDPKHEFHDLIHDLVQYSFLTTGFKSTRYSFNDLLPASYFLDSMHGKVIQAQIEKLNDNTKNNINYNEAITLIAKTHHNNYKIVKTLGTKSKGDEAGKIIRSEVPITNKDTLKKLSTGENTYLPFFKKRSGNTLYMLTGKEDGFPVYTRISKIDNKDFNTYLFSNIEKGLELDTPEYISPMRKLYEGAPSFINKDIGKQTTQCKK